MFNTIVYVCVPIDPFEIIVRFTKSRMSTIISSEYDLLKPYDRLTT